MVTRGKTAQSITNKANGNYFIVLHKTYGILHTAPHPFKHYRSMHSLLYPSLSHIVCTSTSSCLHTSWYAQSVVRQVNVFHFKNLSQLSIDGGQSSMLTFKQSQKPLKSSDSRTICHQFHTVFFFQIGSGTGKFSSELVCKGY